MNQEKTKSSDALANGNDGGKSQSSQVKVPGISLPKGGGAIKSIDDKFQVNAANGTAGFSIPFPFSPSRNAFMPALSLSYNSGSGNSIFGLGWNAETTSVARKTEKKLPEYNDALESDVFIFSGAEDLVPVFVKDDHGNWIKDESIDGSIKRYRPRIEGGFARIEKITEANGNLYWKVTSKENIVSIFGRSKSAQIFDPTDETKIFKWLLEFSYDDKGNCFQLEYKKEDKISIPGIAPEKNRLNDYSKFTNAYLKRIKYCSKESYLKNNSPEFLLELVLDYGDHDLENPRPVEDKEWTYRPDAFSDCRAGFDIRTYRLCRRALMYHHFSELGSLPCLVRSMDFKYEPGTAFTFLRSITQTNYLAKTPGVYVSKSLPPVEFTYEKLGWDTTIKSLPKERQENLPVGIDDQSYQWTDLYGEGLSGILTEQAGAWYYKRNSGAGNFDALKLVSPIPSLNGLSTGAVHLQDLEANGQKFMVSNDMNGFYEFTPGDEWMPFKNFNEVPNINVRDPNVKFIDLNADGKADILISEEDVFVWYASKGKKGFESYKITRKPADEEQGPAIVFADSTQSIVLADMSGDGLMDIARIRNNDIVYWPNLGYGKFGAKITMSNAPLLDNPDNFNPGYIKLADIDGSGVTDLVYLGKDSFKIYFNQSGNSWSEENIVQGINPLPFPKIDDQVNINIIDLLGTGTGCIVWSSPLPAYSPDPLRYIDLMDGRKPHIMTSYKNNMGKEVSIEYKPSTYFYLQDKKTGAPWITKLPFPVQCVSRTISKDTWRQTQFSNQFTYHHGYYDYEEREFRGFGRVDQVDVESFGEFATGNITSPYITAEKLLYQPPVMTRSWFYTGAFLNNGKILDQFEHEYFAPSSPAFHENNLPGPDLDALDLTITEHKEALRSCKGMSLRQEVYELHVDEFEKGNFKTIKLFSTSYHNCHIQLIQPQKENVHAVFLTTASEAITYNYELDLSDPGILPDPRIAHTLNVEIDGYGNVLQSIAIVYQRIGTHVDATLPAGAEALIAGVQQKKQLAYTVNRFTKDAIDENNYQLRLPCEVRSYELTGILPKHGFYFSLEELRSTTNDGIPEISYQILPDNTTLQKRMVECVRILYFKEDLSGSEILGTVNHLGLPYETYRLALTKDLLNSILETKLTELQRPGETYDEMLLRVLSTGGYHFEDNAWWIRSGIAGFNNNAAEHFYLPENYTDPFDNTTRLQFDPYDLFIKKSWDALLNETEVLRFDYRVLAPLEMSDINENLSEVVFDILGMPAAMAVKGKGNEGDNLDHVSTEIDETLIIPFFTNTGYDETQSIAFLGNATARYVYYLGETTVGGNITYGNYPAAVAVITREQHVSQPATGKESPLHIAFQYADGSGTVIAAKAQAEPETEPGPLRWITNGKTILNNKGKPVKQYEPYFTANHVYEEPAEVGVTPIMYYDAPGRLVRTEMPDGSLSRVEFSPWEFKSFDANDTVLESRWYRERLTASERGVLLFAPGASANEIAEALAAEAIANIAPIEQKDAARSAGIHAGTAAQTFLDSFGREVIAVAHNKWETRTDSGTIILHDEKYLTYTKLDAEGKPLWIKDARENLVMQYVYPPSVNNRTEPNKLSPPADKYVPCYDIAGNLLFQHSMDGGNKWTINDAGGKPMFAWDVYKPQETAPLVENRFYFTQYNQLHRPTGLWLKIDNSLPVQIELFEYNDSTITNGAPNPDLLQLKAANLIGRLSRHYDSSGLVENIAFDFKGNALKIQRQLLLNKQSTITGWQTNPQTKLETKTYIHVTEYDALNRMTRHFNWHKGNGSRVAVYLPEYNQRGSLKKEVLVVGAEKINALPGYRNGTTSDAIAGIRYNVKGQREYLKLGNGTVTRYSYDEKTFRLKQLRTTRTDSALAFPTYHSGLQDVSVLQQLNYTYDPVGNITDIYDEAFEPSFFQNQQVDPHNQYTYDAMYRLIEAKGRENVHLNQAPGHGKSTDISMGTFPIMDAGASRNYIQQYRYDAVGNILQMRHLAGSGSFSERWTRHYSYAFENPSIPASNRLLKTWTGSNPAANSITYQYDSHGSMLNLANVPDEFKIQWDHRDMIASINLGNGTANYQYDSNKQRTRKYLDYGSNVEERIYLGGLEIYQRTQNGTLVEEIETLHLFDGEQRLLMVDQIINTNNSNLGVKDLYRYTLSNHLGSATMELDEHAQIISYEEYHPYGTSAYRAGRNDAEVKLKRYRYTGMERDEESGLEYHSARYYLPWLGRWLSTDPTGIINGTNFFNYCSNNPVVRIDTNGMADKKPEAVIGMIDAYGDQLSRGAKKIAEHPFPHKLAEYVTAMNPNDTSNEAKLLRKLIGKSLITEKDYQSATTIIWEKLAADIKTYGSGDISQLSRVRSMLASGKSVDGLKEFNIAAENAFKALETSGSKVTKAQFTEALLFQTSGYAQKASLRAFSIKFILSKQKLLGIMLVGAVIIGSTVSFGETVNKNSDSETNNDDFELESINSLRSTTKSDAGKKILEAMKGYSNLQIKYAVEGLYKEGVKKSGTSSNAGNFVLALIEGPYLPLASGQGTFWEGSPYEVQQLIDKGIEGLKKDLAVNDLKLNDSEEATIRTAMYDSLYLGQKSNR